MLRRVRSSDPFLSWACLIALGMGGCMTQPEPATREEPVAAHSAALQAAATVYLPVQVFVVHAGFNDAVFQAALAESNRLFANTGIQFTYLGSQAAKSTVCSDADRTEVVAEGSLHSDVIPVFHCVGTAGYGGEDIVIWSDGVGLDHEFGHYLSLNHTFNYCWTASQAEADRLNAEDTRIPNPACTGWGGWKSVESEITNHLNAAAAACPQPIPGSPEPTSCFLDGAIAEGFGIRDARLDGDGFSDTPPALHVYDPSVSNSDRCAPGYRVPLFVNVLGVSYDYSFEPGLYNRMDYFDCVASEGPDAYSPQQIQAMQDTLTSTRSHLSQSMTP